MPKTIASRYDVAKHLRTPEEMAPCLQACLDEADGEADGEAAFFAKALGDLARANLKVVAALGLKLHAEAAHR